MKKFKNPDELEDFITALENSNKTLSEDVKKLKEQLKKLRKSQNQKSEMEIWFYGEKEDENDEDEKE